MFDKNLLEEKFKDENFVKELLSQKTAEDAKACFEKNGIEVSLDEVKEAGEMLHKIASGEINAEDVEKMSSGELSEEELEEVAGGSLGTGISIALALTGTAIGAGGTATTIIFWDEVKSGVSTAWDVLTSW